MGKRRGRLWRGGGAPILARVGVTCVERAQRNVARARSRCSGRLARRARRRVCRGLLCGHVLSILSSIPLHLSRRRNEAGAGVERMSWAATDGSRSSGRGEKTRILIPRRPLVRRAGPQRSHHTTLLTRVPSRLSLEPRRLYDRVVVTSLPPSVASSLSGWSASTTCGESASTIITSSSSPHTGLTGCGYSRKNRLPTLHPRRARPTKRAKYPTTVTTTAIRHQQRLVAVTGTPPGIRPRCSPAERADRRT